MFVCWLQTGMEGGAKGCKRAQESTRTEEHQFPLAPPKASLCAHELTPFSQSKQPRVHYFRTKMLWPSRIESVSFSCMHINTRFERSKGKAWQNDICKVFCLFRPADLMVKRQFRLAQCVSSEGATPRQAPSEKVLFSG